MKLSTAIQVVTEELNNKLAKDAKSREVRDDQKVRDYKTTLTIKRNNINRSQRIRGATKREQ